VELVQAYHQHVIDRVQKSSRAKEINASDPGYSRLLASWLGSNVSFGNEPGERV
jgi:hypothetical protein